MNPVIKKYLERRQAKKEAKKKKGIIIPGEVPKEDMPTTTILEKPIKLNRLTGSTTLAFGVTTPREVEILRKMIAVAKLYPKYSTIAEVLLNCSDRFTEMERLYSLFVLGRVQGQSALLKYTKAKIRFNAATMPLEGRLLAMMSKNVLVEDKLLNRIMRNSQ